MTAAAQKLETITIKPANLVVIPLRIEGTAPYVQHKFSEKARNQIKATQEGGSTERKGKKRDPKDFAETWKQAMHIGKDGRYGIPAGAFRQACISACRLIGFKMTLAKLAVFVVADTFDRDEGTPLVHLDGKLRPIEKTPIMQVRNDNGSVDLRLRPMWDEWQATLRIRFDADVFTATDVANLIGRVGEQVGIGEGRPDSKNSSGLGWGTFRIISGGPKRKRG